MKRIRVGILNDTRNAHHMGCWLVMKNLRQLLDQHGMQVKWSWPTGRDWREDPKANRRGNVDLVLVNGEGSIHDSRQHHLAERFASIAQHFGQKFGIPCILINSTVHNNEPWVYDLLAEYSGIFTRDSYSTGLLNSVGIQAETVSDLTLAFPINRMNKSASDGPPMITDSADPDVSRHMRVLSEDYPGTYSPIQFARFPHSNLLGKPRVYLGKARRWAMDKIRYYPSLGGYLNQMCGSSLVVTGRYHAVTMCLLTQTPFLAVESLVPKISWLLQDALGSTRRVFPDVETLQESGSWLQAPWTEDELESLKRFLKNAREANQAMAAKIRASI